MGVFTLHNLTPNIKMKAERCLSRSAHLSALEMEGSVKIRLFRQGRKRKCYRTFSPIYSRVPSSRRENLLINSSYMIQHSLG